MYMRKQSILFRLVAVILTVVLICPISANAVEPRASYYLDSYNSYIYPAGGGKVQVWFTVTGVNYMDELGALTVILYESADGVNWTRVYTYKHADYSNMLGYDKVYYSSHVDYQGVAGRYYQAYVCIWAGKDGGGDTRYMWTSVKKAT